MKTWAACLPGDQAKAMLNEMAEKILDLLDAEISFTRNAEETGRLLQLADFGLCAATDKTLRWRLYLRYGAVLPPDRVRRTFVSFIQREFPACEWEFYLAEMRSFHTVVLSRHPGHFILPASADGHSRAWYSSRRYAGTGGSDCDPDSQHSGPH